MELKIHFGGSMKKIGGGEDSEYLDELEEQKCGMENR